MKCDLYEHVDYDRFDDVRAQNDCEMIAYISTNTTFIIPSSTQQNKPKHHFNVCVGCRLIALVKAKCASFSCKFYVFVLF